MSDLAAEDDVKQEHYKAFGPNLGPIYHELYNEVIWLHAKWAEYRKLYAKSKERIDLLNKSASFLFYVIECTLREDVLLHIARLTDPPEMFRKYKNLTLQSLPDLVDDKKLADDLRVLIKECLKRSRFVRKLRDKKLAHIDLSHAVNAKAFTLPGTSQKKVEDVLSSIRKVMNRLHGAFLDSEVGFDHFIVRKDANLLVHNLAVAARYEERQRERFHKHQPLPEDFESLPDI